MTPSRWCAGAGARHMFVPVSLSGSLSDRTDVNSDAPETSRAAPACLTGKRSLIATSESVDFSVCLRGEVLGHPSGAPGLVLALCARATQALPETKQGPPGTRPRLHVPHHTALLPLSCFRPPTFLWIWVALVLRPPQTWGEGSKQSGFGARPACACLQSSLWETERPSHRKRPQRPPQAAGRASSPHCPLVLYPPPGSAQVSVPRRCWHLPVGNPSAPPHMPQ